MRGILKKALYSCILMVICFAQTASAIDIRSNNVANGVGVTTLNSGTNVGLTTPGAMTAGNTYTIGSTSDNIRFNDLGLGVASPTGGGQLSLTQGSDGTTGILVKRHSTDATGTFLDLQSSTGTSLFKIAQSGALTLRPASNIPLGIDYISNSTTPTNGGGYYYYNQLEQLGDTFPTATGTTTYGWNYGFQYGGAGGGAGTDVGSKVGLNITTTQTSAVQGVNAKDTVSLQGVVTSSFDSGGTNTGAGAVGALFAGALQTTPLSGATNYLQFGGLEIGLLNGTGSTAKYRTGLSVVDYGNGGNQGAFVDCALCVTAATLVSGGGWGTGLLFSKSMGGQVPVTSGGTLIGTEGAVTVTHGLDLSGYTFSSDSLKAPGFSVNGSGTVNSNVGYTVSSAATKWSILQGDGTKFTSAKPCIVTRPSVTSSNSAASDVDFSGAIYTIAANDLGAQNWLEITIHVKLTTGTAASEIWYLKIGGTKVWAQVGGATPANSATRYWSMTWNIIGTAAAGASVPVDVSEVSVPLQSNTNFFSSTDPVSLATNGSLAVLPGITWGTNANGDTATIVDVAACWKG